MLRSSSTLTRSATSKLFTSSSNPLSLKPLFPKAKKVLSRRAYRQSCDFLINIPQLHAGSQSQYDPKPFEPPFKVVTIAQFLVALASSLIIHQTQSWCDAGAHTLLEPEQILSSSWGAS